MKRLYFSIILGLTPVFSLNPARGEQPAPTEHKHEDGTACTADHGHEGHQHKEGVNTTVLYSVKALKCFVILDNGKLAFFYSFRIIGNSKGHKACFERRRPALQFH